MMLTPINSKIFCFLKLMMGAFGVSFIGLNAMFGQTNPIQVGDTTPGFFHATFLPTVTVKDTYFSLESEPVIFQLDIDGDNSNDLSINSYYYQSLSGGPFGPTYYPVWRCGLTLFNGCDIVAVQGNWGKPDTLNLGEPINASSNWRHGSGGEATFCVNVNNYTLDSTWKNKNQYYVGLRLSKPSGDTLFGWLKVRVQEYHVVYLEGFAAQSNTPNDTIFTVYAGMQEATLSFGDKHSLFPNPLTGSSKLRSTRSLNLATIFIKDEKGITHAELKDFSGFEIPVPSEMLSTGMYFVEIIENEKLSRNRIFYVREE